MAIEVAVKGLETLNNATGEMAKWGKKPFSGKASLRIKKIWAKDNLRTFKTKGRSIKETWPKLSPEYASWKKRHYPSKPLLVLKGDLRDSVSNPKSRLMVYNTTGGRQLILGTRVPYASAHNYGTKKLPMRKFIKVTQAMTNTWANEMRKDVELASKGKKSWRGR